MQKLTPLTESALLTALTVIVAVIAVYMPFIGIIATLIWACPIIVLTVRHGLRYGLMAVFAATFITALLITPTVSLRLSLAFAPGGLVMGWCLRKGLGALQVFVPSLIASVLAKVLGLSLIFLLTAVNPLDMQIETLRESFDATFDLYENMGLDAAAIAEAKARMKSSIDLVAMIMPLIVVLMGLTDTLLCFKLLDKILPRLGHKLPEFLPFSRWRFSVAFLYLTGFSLVGMYWGETRGLDLLYRASLNANMLCLMLGLTEGLSLIRYLTLKFKVSAWVFYVAFFIIITNGILAQLAAITGLLDMAFDYRHRFGRTD